MTDMTMMREKHVQTINWIMHATTNKTYIANACMTSGPWTGYGVVVFLIVLKKFRASL